MGPIGLCYPGGSAGVAVERWTEACTSELRSRPLLSPQPHQIVQRPIRVIRLHCHLLVNPCVVSRLRVIGLVIGGRIRRC